MRTEKSRKREILTVDAQNVARCEAQAKFYFEQRHNWSEAGGGYEFCRKKFLELRKLRKSFLAHTAKMALKYSNLYAN